MSAPASEAPRRNAGGQWLGFALLVACAGIFGFAIGSRVREPPLAEVTLTLSDAWQEGVTHVPLVLAPLRDHYWPDWLLLRDKWTKSVALDANRPAIAIVIDDSGVDEALTREAMMLPDAVTLAFLPDPQASWALSRQAYRAGHEIILHLPMEPKGRENPGPMALKSGLSRSELARRLNWALSRVADYDGVNNHMGSRFTASRAGLIPVMRELSARGLFFLDSRTTPDTQGEKLAREAGLLTGARDVFVDNRASAAAIVRALLRVEERARANGSVIAIAHPHPATIAALKSWTKDVESRGFRLVPLKTVLQLRAEETKSTKLSALARP